MSDGNEISDIQEAPPEKMNDSESLDDLNLATHDSNDAVELRGDVKTSEETQKEFEVVVIAVQAVEAAQPSPAPPAAEGSGSKSDFGTDRSQPGENYSGVEMTQGEVAQDSDWNEESKNVSDSRKSNEAQAEEKNAVEKAAAGEVESKSGGDGAQKGPDPDSDASSGSVARTGAGKPENPFSELSSETDQTAAPQTTIASEKYSAVEMTQGEVAQDSDWNEDSEETQAESDQPEGSGEEKESGDGTANLSGADQDQIRQDTSSFNMEVAADMVTTASDKITGFDLSLEAANEKLRDAEDALRDAKEAVRDHKKTAQKPERDPDAVKPQDDQDTEAGSQSSSTIKGSDGPTLGEQLNMLQGDQSVNLDDIAEAAKSQEGHEDETTGEGKGKKGETSFNTPAGENLINFSARSGGVVGLQVAGSVIPGAAVLSSAIGGSTSSGDAPSSGSEGGTSDLAAEQNTEFITLQNNIQQQSRQFQTLSNVLRARHDITQSSLRNMRGDDDTGTNPGDQSHSSPAEDPRDAAQMAQESMQQSYQDTQQELEDMAENVKEYNKMKEQIRNQADTLKDSLMDPGFQAEDAGNIVLTGFIAEYKDDDLVKPEQTITLTKAEAESLLKELEASLDDTEESTRTPELTKEQLDELKVIQEIINESGGSVDIETLVQLVMFELYESEEDQLNDILEDMKATNEAKGKMRDLINEYKEQKNKAKETMLNEYNDLIKSDSIPVTEQVDLTPALEPVHLIPGSSIIVDESLSNAEKSNLRDAISTLREEVLMLQEEVDDWHDHDTRTITYNEVIQVEPDYYEVKEVTKTMTKDEAKSLIASMENLITALEKRLDEG